MPASGCAVNVSTSGEAHAGGNSVSLLMKATYVPEAVVYHDHHRSVNEGEAALR